MRKTAVWAAAAIGLGWLVAGPGALSPAAAAAPAAARAEIVSTVNFRAEPSTAGKRISYLHKGDDVTVLDAVNKYWYKVRTEDGRTGYVSSSGQYIKLGQGSAASPAPVPAPPASGGAERAVSAGMAYLGTPYEYGSSRATKTTFDCSDFVRQAFKDGTGITLPADSRQQGAYVKSKGAAVYRIADLKRGDLMFFMAYKGAKASAYAGLDKSKQTINHVGIYLGDGKVLHTYSAASGGVRVDAIADKHWTYRFLFGGSAL